MARFHLHVAVHDLQHSIAFYSRLFGQQPAVEREDYAKWLLADPALNFAISTRGHEPGVNHLGFQAETAAEFERLQQRAAAMDLGASAAEAQCCYARSEKYWILDPQGLAWEHFRTLEDIPVYGEDAQVASSAAACCVPLKPSASACCVPADAAAGSDCCRSPASQPGAEHL